MTTTAITPEIVEQHGLLVRRAGHEDRVCTPRLLAVTVDYPPTRSATACNAADVDTEQRRVRQTIA